MILKYAIRYCCTVFLVLIMLAALFVLFAPRLGWRFDIVLSNSMAPTMKAGGIAVTRPRSPADLGVSDIITYGSPIDGKLVTHRVSDIKQTGRLLFQTKGEANEDPDPYLVPPENVVGEICLYIPLIGFIAKFLKTPLVLILAVSLPGLAIIIMQMRTIWLALHDKEGERRYQTG